MLRVAVIGVGHWGPHLVRCLSANPAVQLAAVVDHDLDRARSVAPRGVEVFASLAQTPKASLDAVVIATPAATHTALVREALEAGLHVLVEKPLASSVADAELLATLAQQHARTLMVGHLFLFHPAVLAVKGALGDLGALRVITMERLNLGPVRRDVGAVFDLLAHEVSILETWLDATPAQVSAVGGQWLRGGGVDSAAATLTWRSGVVAHLHASWLHPVKKRAVSLVGERGMLTWDELDRAAPLRWFGSTVEGSTPRPVEPRVIEVPAAEPLQAEVDHFVACVAGGQAVRSDARFGARVVRTLAAIEASMAQAGAPVRP
jgi:predicted dehydrogenase